MSNPRKFTTLFNARVNELQSALKAKGVRSDKKRRELINRAASSRPADLARQAREAIQERRVKRNLDLIAGRQA